MSQVLQVNMTSLAALETLFHPAGRLGSTVLDTLLQLDRSLGGILPAVDESRALEIELAIMRILVGEQGDEAPSRPLAPVVAGSYPAVREALVWSVWTRLPEGARNSGALSDLETLCDQNAAFLLEAVWGVSSQAGAGPPSAPADVEAAPTGRPAITRDRLARILRLCRALGIGASIASEDNSAPDVPPYEPSISQGRTEVAARAALAPRSTSSERAE